MVYGVVGNVNGRGVLCCTPGIRNVRIAVRCVVETIAVGVGSAFCATGSVGGRDEELGAEELATGAGGGRIVRASHARDGRRSVQIIDTE